MSTIQENATASPVNCEQNAGCLLFTKDKEPVSAPMGSSDIFEAVWLRCAQLLRVLKCKRGKMQMHRAECLFEEGERNAPEQK